MRTLLSIEKFAELAKASTEGADPGIVLADIELRKGFAVEVEKAEPNNPDSRQLVFTISTPAVDRQNDSIAVEGWQLENYRKNPVVLWVHDTDDLPVARSLKTWIEANALKSIADFATPEMYPFADQVYKFYLAKFLNATSVGFNPLEYSLVDDPQRRYGVNFIRQELLEYSCVPVPANPEALQSRGIDIDPEPLVEWAVDVIRRHVKPELKTVRDIEHFLRDVGGFSRKEAKQFAAPGYEAIQRDAEAAAQPTAPPANIGALDPAELAAITATLSKTNTDIKGAISTWKS